jgi:hypothetical protein
VAEDGMTNDERPDGIWLVKASYPVCDDGKFVGLFPFSDKESAERWMRELIKRYPDTEFWMVTP